MKLGILMVSIREIANSFPDWHVKYIFSQRTISNKKQTVITLSNQNFDEVEAILDEDGRLINRESLIEKRSILNN